MDNDDDREWEDDETPRMYSLVDTDGYVRQHWVTTLERVLWYVETCALLDDRLIGPRGETLMTLTTRGWQSTE
jgi:hypothetical protein